MRWRLRGTTEGRCLENYFETDKAQRSASTRLTASHRESPGAEALPTSLRWAAVARQGIIQSAAQVRRRSSRWRDITQCDLHIAVSERWSELSLGKDAPRNNFKRRIHILLDL